VREEKTKILGKPGRATRMISLKEKYGDFQRSLALNESAERNPRNAPR